MPFVEDLDGYGRLGKGSQSTIGYIAEFPQASDGIDRGSGCCKATTRGDGEVVGNLFAKLLASKGTVKHWELAETRKYCAPYYVRLFHHEGVGQN